MFEIKGLCAGYGRECILHEISCTIPSGAITVIAGPNGCGKSTLLRTIAGINPPWAGSIRLDGKELRGLEPRETARLIAYLAQSRQIPEITVERLVLHGRFPYLSYPRRYRQQDLQIARQAMMTMGIADLAQRSVQSLSGGQRQKAYIAMALAQETPVIFMDEPTTFLDIAHQMQMMDQARFLANAGKTVVLVLHDMSMALKWADHIVVMEHGKITAQGDPETIYTGGCLDAVLGVRVARILTSEGWQYYYQQRGVEHGIFSDAN